MSGNKYLGLSSYTFTTTDTFSTAKQSYTLGLAGAKNLSYTGIFNFVGNGNKFANQITGNQGNDTLNGREGSDILTGGLGDDKFVLNTKLGPNNIDTITDFAPGDKIALGKNVFKVFKSGLLSEDAFISVNDTQDMIGLDDRIIYEITSGKLYYDADGAAEKSDPIQIALIGIDAHPLIDSNDFIIL